MNLVFIVEEVPKNSKLCPYSKWRPNPPILEEPGYYTCSLGGYCDLKADKCSHLKSLGTLKK